MSPSAGSNDLRFSPETKVLIGAERDLPDYLSPAAVDSAARGIDTIREIFQQSEHQALFLNTADIGTQGVIGAGFASASGVGNPGILLAGAGAMAATAFSKLFEQIEQEELTELRYKVSIADRNNPIGREGLRTLASVDPALFVRTIFGPGVDRFYDSAEFPDLSSSDLAALNENRIRRLTEMVASKFARERYDQQLINGVQGERIEAQEQKVKGLFGHWRRCQKSLSSIRKELRDVKERIGTLQESVDFANQMLFDQASAETKLAMLERGFLDQSLTPGQREEKGKQLQAEIASQKALQAIKSFSENLKYARTIARNLGVELGSDLDRLLDVVQIGMDSAIAFASGGGVLAAVSVASGIFSLGRATVDPSTQALRVDVRQILAELNKLSRELAAFRREVLDRLDQLTRDGLYSRRLIVELFDGGLTDCESFITSRQDFGHDGRSFPSYAQATQHYRQYKYSYLSGRQYLERLFLRIDRPSSFLALQTHEGSGPPAQGDAMRIFRERLFLPAYYLYSELCRTSEPQISPGSGWAALCIPSIDHRELRRKRHAIDTLSFTQPLLPYQMQPQELAETLLEPVLLDRVCNNVCEFLPYYEWIDNSEFRSLAGLRGGQIPTIVVQQMNILSRSLQACRVGIMQQSLLQGDMLLVFIAELFARAPSDEKERLIDATNQLLLNNYLLAENLAIWFISRGSLSAASYAYLIETQNLRALQQWLPMPLKWEVADKPTKGSGGIDLTPGLVLNIGWGKVKPPSVNLIATGAFRQQSSMPMLARTYARLTNEFQVLASSRPESQPTELGRAVQSVTTVL